MLKTFRKGGVHPGEYKLTENNPVQVLPIPKKVAIPVSQHAGIPAKIIVNKGDIVKTGQLIAKGEGFITSNIHSSVSGKVNKIDFVVDASGYRRQSVIIDVENDTWEDSIDQSGDLITDIKLSEKEIINQIKEMGIVGMGGAAFPSQVKLMVPEGKKAEYLIINGVECEPFLTSDHRIMLEKGDEVMIGISILMKALGVKTAIIGIENNKRDAIAHLEKLATKHNGIRVQALKVKYPQGAEKQLIKALINREVPSGKLPIEVGAIVNNVGTAFAVYEAVQKNKPLIGRVVTVTGQDIKKPGNYLVRIGTSLADLLEFVGGVPENTGKIISGGPMMGKSLTTIEVPVVKGMSGILVLAKKFSARPHIYPCIRCGKCVSVCPMGLSPFYLSQLVDNSILDEAEKERVMDCIECGSCAYTCPAGRPLLDQIRTGKSKVGIIIRNRGKS